jgi:hypothetical protein
MDLADIMTASIESVEERACPLCGY